MSPFISGIPGICGGGGLNTVFTPSMNVYCPNLQVDYCNLLMIKVMQIKNIYENLSYLHCQDSNFTHFG